MGYYMATANTRDQMTEEGRALLTDREREILSGEADVNQNYQYKVESTVRNRVRKRFEADAELLADALPEVYELLTEAVCDGNATAGAGDENRRLREAIDNLQTERDDLQDDLADAHERIEVLEERCRQQAICVDRALDELPEDVPGRLAVEDARAMLREDSDE